MSDTPPQMRRTKRGEQAQLIYEVIAQRDRQLGQESLVQTLSARFSWIGLLLFTIAYSYERSSALLVFVSQFALALGIFAAYYFSQLNLRRRRLAVERALVQLDYEASDQYLSSKYEPYEYRTPLGSIFAEPILWVLLFLLVAFTKYYTSYSLL